MTVETIRSGLLRPEMTSRLWRGARRVRHSSLARRLLRPAVSVILPIYNVERYLAECLDSIAAQSFGDYEVVVVDDGSPDGSRAIAEGYAAQDPRIRLVTRENGGLGAARNTGVRHARGRYLTFLDSDDVLPPHALGALVASARATGSDIVVGSLRRFDANRAWAPDWVRRVHLVPRTGIRLEEFLPLIRNLYTVDKLYRRDFWEAQGLWFREGVAYEDQPLVTQLLARARTIDIIPDDVYHYRRREDQSSISQQTATVADLRQRIAAWRVSREVLRREVSPRVYHGWLQTLFDAHFHWYLTSPGTVDDTYWTELREAVVELCADAPQELWDATSPDKRVLLQLTLQDRREDAQEFVRLESARPDRWPATPQADGVLLELPYLGDDRLDRRLFLLRPEQLRLAQSVENVHWLDEADGEPARCWISGWAYIRKIDLAEHESTVSLVLRNTRTGDERVFESAGPVQPAFPAPTEDDWCDYSVGTFHAVLPLGAVLGDAQAEDTWELLLRVEAAGFTVTEPVSQLVRSGSAGIIPAATLPSGDRVVAEWRVNEVLRFRREPLALQVTEVELSGRRLSGVVDGPALPSVRMIAATSGAARAETGLTGPRSGPRRFTLELPAAADLSTDKPAQWDVAAWVRGSAPLSLTLRERAEDEVVTADGALAVQRLRNGELAVAEWTLGAVAEELSVSRDGELRVAGRVHGPRVETAGLTSRNKKTRTAGPQTPVQGDRFEAVMRLDHEVYRFGRHPLPSGEHDISLRVRRDGVDVDVPLKMSARLNGELPVPVDTTVHEGRVVRGPEGVVRLSLIRPIGDARGRYRQKRLRTGEQRSGGLTRGVLMRSYFGEHATDNGVAIQQELRRRGSDLPVYWAVQDHAVPIPDGGIPVIVNSTEWYKLLSSVAYYVDNMFQPEYHRKPDGQVLVQTFHGYPFKVMGHTHWSNLQVSQARIEAYDARARDWDYLVSPARYATPLLRREFNYPGEVLEIGYPRNDVLLSPEADDIRAMTRRSLGVKDGQTAVLYAPTFRDYMARGDSKATMADFFDFRSATKALGEDVVILVRGHAFNARSWHRVGSGRGIVDVTDYPEVSDLYLAADVGVVDYSSLRFDFGVTGKPMIFLVPDLQRYNDTRGWLFDFEPTAPGPLAATTDEVVAHLRDLDGVRRDYRRQYDDFRSQYLDLEDGHAARRFVDAVFVPRGDA